MLSHLSSLLAAEAEQLRGPLRYRTWLWRCWRAADTSSGRLQKHWVNRTEVFHPSSFPHTRFANAVLALSGHKTWCSVSELSPSLRSPRAPWGLRMGWSVLWQLPTSTLPLPMTGGSTFQIHTGMSKRYQDLCSKYLARRRRPSLPPCLPWCSRVSAGTHRQKAVAFPKSNRKTWNSSRPAGCSLPRVCLIHSCKVKAMSLPDTFTLIKGLVIPHLPIQVYPYTHLLGYLIHKALNKMPFFFVLTF